MVCTEISFLPEVKKDYPTRPGDAPFRQLEKMIEVDRKGIWIEAKREVKAQAVRQLKLLDELYKELVQKAGKVIAKAQEDVALHEIPVNAAKRRGRIYYLYQSGHSETSLFFSILEPAEYAKADPHARFMGMYRLNEDSTWSRLDSDDEAADHT